MVSTFPVPLRCLGSRWARCRCGTPEYRSSDLWNSTPPHYYRCHQPTPIITTNHNNIHPNISSTRIDTHKGQVVRHKIPHKSKCCSAPRRHFSSLLSSFSVVVVSTLSSVTLIRFIITQPSVVLHRFEPLSPFSLEHLAVAPSVILVLVIRFVVETTW